MHISIVFSVFVDIKYKVRNLSSRCFYKGKFRGKRVFALEVGVYEDSVTGSAHCILIPYRAEKIGKNKLFAKQISACGGNYFVN